MISDPESMINGTGRSSGSFRHAKVSVARAPRNEHPGGRDRCFLSSIVVSFVLSFCTCV